MRYLLWHLLDETADATPDQVAYRHAEHDTSFAQLADDTNRLARTLIDIGIKPGDRVGVMLPRSLQVPLAVYGILKAGAVFVPVDVQAPPERISGILGDCEINVLICDPSRRRTLARVLKESTPLHTLIGPENSPDSRIHCISWTDIGSQSSARPGVKATDQDLAYIMYTSGSTGRPKGIMHTHRSGMCYADLAVDTYGIVREDRVASFAPLHVDQCTFALFCSPLAGATTIVVPDAFAAFPGDLAQLIERERITVWYSVPLALIMLLERGELERVDHSSLRWVTYGGEPFPPAQLRALMAHWPRARFSNVYGPAEVNQCTFYHFTSSDVAADTPVPIGHVWDNTQALIVDDNDRVIHTDEAGELLIRSPTMMTGYWRRPDLDASAFFHVDHPAQFRTTYYRTGDLARRDDHGLLHFIGRRDRQVKIRGQRVELEEVEAVLNSHAAVLEAAAFIAGATASERHVLAAVLLRDAHDLSVRELLRHAKRVLPQNAVPRDISIEMEFPRTGGGKIDRNALAQRVADKDPG